VLTCKQDPVHHVVMSTHQTVLITGGSAGIGLALARRYHRRGDTVIVGGRSVSRLDRLRGELPHVRTLAGDLSRPSDREELAQTIAREHPRLDVLINNAGIQRRIGIAADDASWAERQAEIDILLGAPIHLTALLVPILLKRPEGAQIVNVTSGGAFTPQPFAPTYSAAKAALHSYTMTLRHSLASTSVCVTELIPPAVATGLAGPGQSHGADVDAFGDAAFEGITARREEVGFGPTASEEFEQLLANERARFDAASTRFAVATF